MNNNNEFLDLINQHIPNFKRFQEALGQDNDVVENLEMMLKKVYEVGLIETIGKHINLELGLCILKDKEIDQKKLREIMNTFRN